MICLGNLTAILGNDELHEATKLEVAKAIRTSLTLTEPEFVAIMEEIEELKSDVEKFNL